MTLPARSNVKTTSRGGSTVIPNVARAVFPASSVAVHVTTVVPIRTCSPKGARRRAPGRRRCCRSPTRCRDDRARCGVGRDDGDVPRRDDRRRNDVDEREGEDLGARVSGSAALTEPARDEDVAIGKGRCRVPPSPLVHVGRGHEGSAPRVVDLGAPECRPQEGERPEATPRSTPSRPRAATRCGRRGSCMSPVAVKAPVAGS